MSFENVINNLYMCCLCSLARADCKNRLLPKISVLEAEKKETESKGLTKECQTEKGEAENKWLTEFQTEKRG